MIAIKGELTSECYPEFYPAYGAFKCLFLSIESMNFTEAEGDCKLRTNRTGGLAELRNNETFLFIHRQIGEASMPFLKLRPSDYCQKH